jgi:hypothetical protein
VIDTERPLLVRVPRRVSVSQYRSGCWFCGHDVQFISRQAVEGGPEAAFFDRCRETEIFDEPIPMCATCAKGPFERHHRQCRGCQF